MGQSDKVRKEERPRSSDSKKTRFKKGRPRGRPASLPLHQTVRFSRIT